MNGKREKSPLAKKKKKENKGNPDQTQWQKK